MRDGEKRDFERLPIEIDGTVTMGDYRNVACRTTNVSFCGALLKVEIPGRIAARVMLTLPDIGVLEGRITRVLRDGFALEFDRSLCAREMLSINKLIMNY